MGSMHHSEKDEPAALGPSPRLSKRSEKFSKGMPPLFKRVLHELMSNAYDPKTNPDGVINFGVAESSVMDQELIEVSWAQH